MRLTRVIGLLLIASMVNSLGCGKNPLASDAGEDLLPLAYVRDDGEFLPDSPSGGTALAGVRVEIIDGPKAGSFAITGPDGSYRLVNPETSHARVRATRNGYEPQTHGFRIGAFDSLVAPEFRLGQSPHTLWGDVRLADVQVAILDGPNAGKVTVTDAAGRYRFDANVTSQPFNVMFTRAGYRPLRVLVTLPSYECVLPEVRGPCDVSRNLRVDAFLSPIG